MPKKTPAKKVPAKKQATKKQTAYQKAIQNPKSAGTSKLRPYDAAWKAEVKKKSAAYDKSVRKKVGDVVGEFSGINDVGRALKGDKASMAYVAMIPFGGKIAKAGVKGAKKTARVVKTAQGAKTVSKTRSSQDRNK
jgi:hypothetical protein